MFIMAIIGIIFFLVLILIAIRFGISKQKSESERESLPVIHTSGIYSIVRKSPREDVEAVKPTKKEISQYLTDKNVDIHEIKLSDSDKNALISLWNTTLENSINEIEEGDKKGLEFYYYDFKEDDEVCKKFLSKGSFITRQEIYKHPELIPPFHLGCRCILKCHHGIEKLKDTTAIGMRPFLRDGNVPPLPEWKHILKI